MDDVSISVSHVAKTSGDIASSVMEVSNKNDSIIEESNNNAKNAVKLGTLIQEPKLNESKA